MLYVPPVMFFPCETTSMLAHYDKQQLTKDNKNISQNLFKDHRATLKKTQFIEKFHHSHFPGKPVLET